MVQTNKRIETNIDQNDLLRYNSIQETYKNTYD